MSRFVVQSVSRAGYAGSARLGRFWPSGQQTEIEVLDQEDDLKPEDAAKASLPTYGKKSLKRLTEDPFLKVLPAGDPLALAQAATDVPTLRAEIERLTEENRKLKDQLGYSDAKASDKDDVTTPGAREPKSRK